MTIRCALRTAVVGLCAVGVLACHGDGLAPLPRGDGPLTGTWIQPGSDGWIQLDLSQSGASVVGYHRVGEALLADGPKLVDPVWVTGEAVLPNVILQWTDSGSRWTLNATLSADGDTLTGTWSNTSQFSASFFRVQRSTR